jgi:F420-dependent oxidoreductase-like protein
VQIFEGQLRFGIHSGQQNTDFPGYVDLWRAAEDAGLDWASVFDHFLPIMADPAGPCYEGFTLLAAMAAHTSRLRCGMIVAGVTYRNPAVFANIGMTIDHISGGRAEIGIGAAWYELEHEQYGIPFPSIGTRMRMLDEACTIIKSLWREETTTFAGRHFQAVEARCEPKPIQDPLPLWIGGAGERKTLRIVARHADGWNTFLGSEDLYRHKLDVLAAHCGEVGRDPADIRKSLVFGAILGADEAEAEERLAERAAQTKTDAAQLRARMVVGTPEQCVERLRPFAELGVGDFLLQARPPGDRRSMELLAREVGPALRAEVGAAAAAP